MGHHHHHGECGGHQHGTKNIRTAFFLNLGFTIIEIIGGIWTGSLAILSDAVHDLGDSFSLGLSWYFQKISDRDSDPKYSFGYKRFSILGALINSVILLGGSLYMLSHAIPALWNPHQPETNGMIGLAILGVIVNGAAVFKLKGGKSLNERAVYLHLIEDVMGWLAVLVGSVVMHFWDVPILDPILSVAISVFVLSNVYKGIKSVINIILQQVPGGINSEELSNKVKEVEGVSDVHDLHVWTMDGIYNVLTMHVVVKEGTPMQEIQLIKKRTLLLLQSERIKHVTMEFEFPGEKCREIGNHHH